MLGKAQVLAAFAMAMLGAAGLANAGPLGPPGLSLAVDPITGDFTSPFATKCGAFSCIAGEGAAVNSLIGQDDPSKKGFQKVPDTAIQHVDWIVVHDGNGNGGYTYYYQLENSSIAALGGHTINTPDDAQPFKGAFIIAGADLDLLKGNPAGAAHADPAGGTVPGQVAGPFANLFPPRTDLTVGPQNGAGKPEFEFAAQKALVGPDSNVIDFNGDLLVTFTKGLSTGRESAIYGAQGTNPVYGPWNTQGAAFTWNSENENPCTGPVGADCEQGLRGPVPGVVTLRAIDRFLIQLPTVER